ncbi:MAG: alkane 1-monooxygenase [Bacteroidetes bacterium]|mgnify:CR=1 FL=1|jgi:alkane 1-monooxygenase|nr:alkane 1-monooxygenase [Bacteroidota bacterium]
MQRLGALRYIGAYVFIVLGYFAFTSSGIATFSLVLFSFVFIPLVELIASPRPSTNNPRYIIAYDIILYSLVLLYSGLLVFFLSDISMEHNPVDFIGKTTSMGMLMGIFGINMAHELGHRRSKFDQFLAQYLLFTSQYTHFFIEHNRGHHKRVATPEDPATARKGEAIYAFWFRSIRDSYTSAWDLENQAMKLKETRLYSWKNDMVKYTVFQLILLIIIGFVFGGTTLLAYVIASLLGILLLESINYIEHYGILRKKINTIAYERVQHYHSWNSDHILGRYLLFELTRHSHHHENSTVKYPELQSKQDSPQLPTGYPGMMLLSFIPPLFFMIMNKRIPQP